MPGSGPDGHRACSCASAPRHHHGSTPDTGPLQRRRILTVFNRRGRGRAALGIVTLTALVSLTACGSSAGSDEGGESAPRVAFVQAHMASTFRTQMIAGVEEAAEAEGVEVDVYNSNNEVIKQNEAMENYVTRGVDVIAVAAIELESALPAVRAASEAGVKVIAVDARIEDPAVSANVGVDNRAGGETMGKLVAEDAAASGGDATVGIVGALNSEIQNARADGFQDALGGKVEVVQIVDGQNRQEKAVDEAENLLTAFPDLTYIYATGEPALIGTLAAIESQGRTDVKVYGWDLSAEGIRALDNDLVEAIANQPAKEEGVQAIEIAARLARGEEVERDNLLDINVITKDNVDEYRADYS
nr:substrate-binding domain-containing protein [Ornithinimicrobium humiphilum]